MNWPWSVLELAATDDEKEIRRAYARKLKRTNPEDDAEGFQALREAYEAALLRARRGDAGRRNSAPETSAPGTVDPGQAAIEAHWNACQALAARLQDGEVEPSVLQDAFAALALDPVMRRADAGPQARAWLIALVAHGAPATDPLVGQAVSLLGCERAALRPDPELAALQAERAAYLAAREALGREVADGAASDVLRSALAAVLASPALDNMSVRDDAEAWLSNLIVSRAPAADALIAPVIEAFGWDRARGLHEDWSIAQVLARQADLSFIERIVHPSNRHHSAWKALTAKPTLWRRLQWRLALGLDDEVTEALAAFDAHGVAAEKLDPDALAWWERRVSSSHVPPWAIWAVIASPLYSLFGLAMTPAGLTWAPAAWLLGTPAALSLLVAGWFHGLARPRQAWRLGYGERSPWLRFGWAPLALLPLFAANLPWSLAVGVIMTLTGVAAAAWAHITAEPDLSGRLDLQGRFRALIVYLPLVATFLAFTLPGEAPWGVAFGGCVLACLAFGLGRTSLAALWRDEMDDTLRLTTLLVAGALAAAAPLAIWAASPDHPVIVAVMGVVATLFLFERPMALRLENAFAITRDRLLYLGALPWLLVGMVVQDATSQGYGAQLFGSLWLLTALAVTIVGNLRAIRQARPA